MMIEVSLMEPYQQRVVEEKIELDDRLERLAAFLLTPTFAGLPTDERISMIRQQGVMREYSRILTERISRFVQ